jgi:two-component system, NtrC family, sensor kinase
MSKRRVRRRRSSAEAQETKFARLTRELNEAREQQAATAVVLKVISRSTFDLQRVLDTLVESAARLCEADMACIVRPQGSHVQFLATYGFSQAFVEVATSTPVAPGRWTLSGRVLAEGRTVRIPDVLADPEYTFTVAQKVAGFRSGLGVPLMREGTPVGVMNLWRYEVRPFTDKQIELVTTFADQAVIAIENTRLLHELRQRTDDLTESLEQQTATSEVLKVISGSPGELEPVFKAMLENATRICEANFGILYRFDGNVFRPVALQDTVPAYGDYLRREPPRTDPRNALGRLFQTKQPVHIQDVAAEPAYAEREPARVATVEIAKARTFLAVPMLKENELLGAVAIYRQEVHPFTDKQIALVQNFAAQAVIAIENTRLLNELRQRTTDLTESLEQQTATADVLRVISSSPTDIQPVLEAIVRTAGKLCDAEYAMLYRLRDGKYYPACWLNNAVAEWVKYLLDHPISVGKGSLIGRTALERRAVHILDCLADAEYTMHEAARIGNQRTMLGVPLLRDGVPIGVIGLLRTSVKPFTEKQIELVTTFADQAVIAIENTRLLNELRESLQQQTATANVLKVISRSTFDLQAVLDTLTASAARLCEADRGAVMRRDGDVYRLASNYGIHAKPDSMRWSILCGRIAAVSPRERR